MGHGFEVSRLDQHQWATSTGLVAVAATATAMKHIRLGWDMILMKHVFRI